MKCLVCAQDHVLDSVDIRVEDKKLVENLVCTDCNAKWTRVWAVSYIEKIYDGDGKEVYIQND